MRALLAAMLAVCAVARAQERPAEVDLPEVLRLLDRSSILAAERSTTEIADAQIVTAGAHPNPYLYYQGWWTVAGAHDAWNGFQNTWQIDQPLLLFDQLGMRTGAASRHAEAARARVEATHAELARQVSRAFIALLAAQRRFDALSAARSELSAVVDLVRGRAGAGDMRRYDQVRMEVELARVDAEVASAHAEVLDTSGRLAAALGIPGWTPRARGDLAEPDPRLSRVRGWAGVREELPSLRWAREESQAAAASVAAAHRDAWPAITVGLGTGFTTDSSANAIYVGLGIPLPIFDHNQGAIAESEAAREVAHAERRALADSSRAELARAQAVLTARREALAQFEAQVLAPTPQMAQMAIAAYRGGASSVLELADASRTQREVQLDYVERLQAVREAEIDVLAAAGLAF